MAGLRVSLFPDWGRRALRLSIALALFASANVWLWALPQQYRAEWGDEFMQACNWGGATCAVVAASPLIGKVAQLSYERTLGTACGGLLGLLVYDGLAASGLPPQWSQALLVLAAACVGALSCFLSDRLKLDQSMRLFVITFLLVTFGAHKDGASASGLALLRTGGIVAGVAVLMTLTVLVLPKSATVQALRELKQGLKLLVELNAVVWSSRAEAGDAMRLAAAKARAAEAAAAAATANAAAGVGAGAAADGSAVAAAGGAAGGGAGGGGSGVWASVLATMHWRHRGSSAAEREPLLPRAGCSGDPELGGAAATAGGKQQKLSLAASPHVSQLTRALQQQQQQHPAGGDGDGGAPSPFAALHPAQDGAAGGASAQQREAARAAAAAVAEKYELRCEQTLTAVYQSMFKVKDAAALAANEAYVWHCFGHYVFLPLFFAHGLVDRVLPRRWRLPAADLEALATSVRVMARLLWTVHLDVSSGQQEADGGGFDDTVAALPGGAAVIGGLLEELGAATGAALGVLVEAFPNKTSILVDELEALSVLVERVLEVGEDTHEALIADLAASRRALRHNPHLHHQLQHPAASGGSAAATAAATPLAASASAPARAATAAAGLIGDGGASPLSPAAAGDSPTARLLQGWGFGAAVAAPLTPPPPPRNVAFVTFDDRFGRAAGHHADCISLVGGSLALSEGGPGAPIPAESPLLLSPRTTFGGAAAAGGEAAAAAAAGVAAAAAVQPADGQQQQQQLQAELMFPLDALLDAAPGGGGGPRSLARHGSSIMSRAHAPPLAVVAALRLHRGGGGAAAGGGGEGGATSACGTPIAAAAARRRSSLLSRSVTAPAAAGGSRRGGGGNGGGLLQQTATTPAAADGSKAAANGGGGGAAAAAGCDGGSSGLPPISFVKLTRWYSLCLLLQELLDEMDNLYLCVRRVAATLPHEL